MAKKVESPASFKVQGRRPRRVKKAKIYLVIAVLLIIFLPSFIKYQALLHKNRTLEEKISFLKGENARLEKEKTRLETDISYIERKAREAMGVVRKGEIVIKEPPKQ